MSQRQASRDRAAEGSLCNAGGEAEGPSLASLADLVPPPVGVWLASAGPAIGAAEEVRVRLHRPVIVYGSDWHRFLGPDRVSATPTGLPVVTRPVLDTMVELMAARSLYAHEAELRQGYLTLPGGHRVGITGRAVESEGRVTTQREWSGLVIRVARTVPGAAAALMALVPPGMAALPSVLVVGPPRSGKTTVLKDAIPTLSQHGWRTVVVDERRELVPALAAAGLHTDVLEGWPKPAGLEAAVRVLGPDVVVVDELGTPADAAAVRLARRSGVPVWASAHAFDRQGVERHPVLGPLTRDGVFDWVVCLAGDGSHRVLEVWRPC
jgi:stage III sporulation protein AA